MATWLQHATWFFDSAWGDVITGIGVPVASAGLAATLVIRQVRSANEARAEDLRIAEELRQEDRRGEAVALLADCIANGSTIAIDEERLGQMSLHTFQANAVIARAYGLLGKRDRVVGDWAAHELLAFANMTHDWARPAMELGTLKFDGLIGPERTEIQRQGSVAIQALLSWQAGDIDLTWFSQNMRPEQQGQVALNRVILQSPSAGTQSTAGTLSTATWKG